MRQEKTTDQSPTHGALALLTLGVTVPAPAVAAVHVAAQQVASHPGHPCDEGWGRPGCGTPPSTAAAPLQLPLQRLQVLRRGSGRQALAARHSGGARTGR